MYIFTSETAIAFPARAFTGGSSDSASEEIIKDSWGSWYGCFSSMARGPTGGVERYIMDQIHRAWRGVSWGCNLYFMNREHFDRGT